VTVVDGMSGAVVRSFFAFPDVPTGGIYVAGGDVDRDGIADVIVGRGSGVPQIRIFSGRTGSVLRDFVAFDPPLPDGVRVGSTDMNGDGHADILAGAGPGSAPTVRVFDGADGSPLAGFEAYFTAFAGGVYVAGADVTGDGLGDIITGAGEGGGPHVRVWDGSTFAEYVGFFAFDPTFSQGVRVAGSDLNGDGRAEIVTGAGPGAPPQVRVFDGASLVALGDFMAYDSSSTNGVYVAGSQPMPRMTVDLPAPDSTVSTPFSVWGWAFDEAALVGTGVHSIHVWAYRADWSTPVLLGYAALGGDRPDVAAVYGDRWRYSGFSLTASLSPGEYYLVVVAHSDVSDTFNNLRIVRITVQ
jgi:hypothetical protein